MIHAPICYKQQRELDTLLKSSKLHCYIIIVNLIRDTVLYFCRNSCNAENERIVTIPALPLLIIICMADMHSSAHGHAWTVSSVKSKRVDIMNLCTNPSTCKIDLLLYTQIKSCVHNTDIIHVHVAILDYNHVSCSMVMMKKSGGLII